MKLIFCNECTDVIALHREPRSCLCGKSSGRYLDGRMAEIAGPCVPLGFANASLIDAIRDRPGAGLGKHFAAFVIPKRCAWVRVAEEGSTPTP